MTRMSWKVLVLAVMLTCLAATGGYAQTQSSTQDTSLGDIARHLQTQKAKEPKPVVVMTNDSVTAPKADSNAGTAKKTTDASANPSPASTKGHDAEYFRTQQSKLQDRLDVDKRELNVLQQKYGQNDMQYYPDPQKALTQQYTREDINKLNDQINAKKQQVDDDEKALSDLREQLRREGGDPGWLRD
jgi:predicted RNase H-like nuclease (RuvC/YqgF family)